MAVKGDSTTLTREDVQHVAHLARLTLTDDEVETYRGQLSAILQHAAVLEQLDTESIDPTASVLPLRNVMRDDKPGTSLSQSEALANAPAQQEGFFKVKSILE
jgi:aspartyl-tRNA(Asn)/glutamyl-tRNA(Gln) amidotransferase subunit C